MFNEYRPLFTKAFWVKFFALFREFMSPDAIAERIEKLSNEIKEDH